MRPCRWSPRRTPQISGAPDSTATCATPLERQYTAVIAATCRHLSRRARHCSRGDGSAAQAMAARITELVNVTLRAEAGPETQLTEAQVHANRSAMLAVLDQLTRSRAQAAGLPASATAQSSFHSNKGTTTCVLPTSCTFSAMQTDLRNVAGAGPHRPGGLGGRGGGAPLGAGPHRRDAGVCGAPAVRHLPGHAAGRQGWCFDDPPARSWTLPRPKYRGELRAGSLPKPPWHAWLRVQQADRLAACSAVPAGEQWLLHKLHGRPARGDCCHRRHGALQVVLGVLGCPNLPCARLTADDGGAEAAGRVGESGIGVLFTAQQGCGAAVGPLTGASHPCRASLGVHL